MAIMPSSAPWTTAGWPWAPTPDGDIEGGVGVGCLVDVRANTGRGPHGVLTEDADAKPALDGGRAQASESRPHLWAKERTRPNQRGQAEGQCRS